MSGFEMVFALFGLLLGLAIAEVLAGFAQTWKARLRAEVRGAEPVRIGWLVPLLGLVVIMDQTAFWLHAYALREAIPLTFLSLLAVLTVVGGYYLLATFVFPDEPDAWPDFDDYYLRTNRIVIGGILLINFAVIGFAVALEAAGTAIVEAETRGPVGDAALLLALPSLIALFFVKSKRANLALLILLNALVLVEAAAGAWGA
ncbi:MAG TPA: hypothetical protein VEW71_08670 [Allosphingosinicella sp.]|nr:hypothetical protein [Allosphingosinicella sp.]